MATSSITANFYTDDPKAANKIIHALFTRTPPSRRSGPTVIVEQYKSEAEKRAFMLRAVKRACECQHA